MARSDPLSGDPVAQIVFVTAIVILAFGTIGMVIGWLADRWRISRSCRRLVKLCDGDRPDFNHRILDELKRIEAVRAKRKAYWDRPLLGYSLGHIYSLAAVRVLTPVVLLLGVFAVCMVVYLHDLMTKVEQLRTALGQ